MQEVMMDDRPSPQERLLAFASEQSKIFAQKREMARSPEASQIRAACALLNWSDGDLAKASGLTINFVGKVQAGAVRPSAKTMNSLRDAFDAAGVILIPQGKGLGEGLGVRLRNAET